MVVVLHPFVWACDLNLLSALCGKQKVGEVLLRRLGTDLHRLRVVEGVGLVNWNSHLDRWTLGTILP